MSTNPLFPSNNDTPDASDDTQDSQRRPVPMPPNPGAVTRGGANPAANLVRQKLARIYADEPDAAKELREAEVVKPRSKHQQFMYDLSVSGKSLADIQTEWHTYYHNLSDEEKHQVWQEFYDTTAQISAQYHPAKTKKEEQAEEMPKKPEPAVSMPKPKPEDTSGTKVGDFTPRELPAKRRTRAIDRRSATEIRRTIKSKVSAGGKLTVKHHLQSLLFGLGMGILVIVIFLFGFFNQVVIAPFLQPGRNADTPIIVDSSGVAPTTTPEVIIPKINVELPVDYSQTTVETSVIENALDSAVVHYPITSMVGQKGNAVFFGHSAGNIFNPGHYKYAFGLLHLLKVGDTFYLTKGKTIYVYKVVSRTIVPPTDVGVLEPVKGYTATATLITCDPPGLSINRLIVVGQQISPDPSQNQPASPGTLSATTASANLNTPLPTLPGNGPSLWSRLTSDTLGKVELIGAFALGAVVLWWSGRLIKKGLH
ncbi:MAG TPA: sortase [Candidatus Saccharimonadales bacterium]|nr:sortase [Candidatus Saccharimonadales bacterium]